MANTKFKIHRIMEIIRAALSLTRMYLAIHQFLNEQPSVYQSKIAPLYFQTVSGATLREAMLGITSLTDENQESINFKFLLDMAENHPRLFKHSPVEARVLVESNRLRLSSLDPVLALLRPVRDRELAHLDRKQLNDPAAISPEPIQTHDLSHCVDILNMILSDIWQALFGVALPEDQAAGHLLKELDTLRKILEKEMDQVGQRD